MGCIELIGFVVFLLFIAVANIETLFLITLYGVPISFVLFTFFLLGEIWELVADIFSEYLQEIIRLGYVLYLVVASIFFGQRWVIPALSGIGKTTQSEELIPLFAVCIVIGIVWGYFALKPIRKDPYPKFRSNSNSESIQSRINELSKTFAFLYGVYYLLLYFVTMYHLWTAQMTPDRYEGLPVSDLTANLTKGIIPLILFIVAAIVTQRKTYR